MAAPTISAFALGFLRWVARRRFRRHFHAVRICGNLNFDRDAKPLIVYGNHSSWWDPMVSILLAKEFLPRRKHYAPMDAASLSRYRILSKIGIFPVELETGRGAIQFIRAGSSILQGAGALWITPQGRFVDTRAPLQFKPGLAMLASHVASTEGMCTLLPLAIEYTFWDERLPEVLLRFGTPVQVSLDQTVEAVQKRLVAALEQTMSDLRSLAVKRDPNLFVTILQGLGRRRWVLWLRPEVESGDPLPPLPGGPHPQAASERRTGEAGMILAYLTEIVTVVVALCALFPAVLFCRNLRDYRPPPALSDASLPLMSVLIPARDEEGAIGAAVASALASTGVVFEVVVMDDGSTDRTASIVQAMAKTDPRVRLEHAPPLPLGWNGKQHACWALAHAAKGDLLCFVDADVRLAPEAIARMAQFLKHQRAALVSGFPQQITKTWMEWMLLPLIHFVLLGFLPLALMRTRSEAAMAAGCGQFILVDRAAYVASGGHAAIRQTMHDGLLLPQLLRRSGYRTDLADITDLATCRMYTSARQVWQGLAKNATEGLGSPERIVPSSFVLLMGQVMPFVLAVYLLLFRHGSTHLELLVGIAVAAAWLPRILAIDRFHQDWRAALLHPFGILLLLALQWYALIRRSLGRAVTWKARPYQAS